MSVSDICSASHLTETNTEATPGTASGWGEKGQSLRRGGGGAFRVGGQSHFHRETHAREKAQEGVTIFLAGVDFRYRSKDFMYKGTLKSL